jgi:hypothetical protein
MNHSENPWPDDTAERFLQTGIIDEERKAKEYEKRAAEFKVQLDNATMGAFIAKTRANKYLAALNMLKQPQ